MRTSGVWYVSASGNTEEKHFPSGVSNGWLQIYAFNGEVKQLFYRFGTANVNDSQIFVRTFYTPSQSWSNWVRLITNTDLENSNFWFQKTVLPWGNYLNGTYTLEEPFTSKPIRIVCGENGRLSGFWPATQIKDIRSIITPDGIINVKFDSNVQITISGATENWNVRGIYRF